MINKYGQDDKSLAALPSKFKSAINRDIEDEKTPNTFPTQIFKGSVAFQQGGGLGIDYQVGGTLASFDAVTGQVVINGLLYANGGINTGTLIATSIVGGTLNNATFGSPTIIGGTANHLVLGTPVINGGTLIGPIINGGTIGTATVLPPPTSPIATGFKGRAYQLTPQIIPPGTATQILFDTASYDPGTAFVFGTAASYFVCQETGFYSINTSAQVDIGLNNVTFYSYVDRNGTIIILGGSRQNNPSLSGGPIGTLGFVQSLSDTPFIASGDTVSLWFYQENAGVVDGISLPEATFLTFHIQSVP